MKSFLVELNMNIQEYFHLQHILTCLSLLHNLLSVVSALTTSYRRRKARGILVILILRRRTFVKSLGPYTKKTIDFGSDKGPRMHGGKMSLMIK